MSPEQFQELMKALASLAETKPTDKISAVILVLGFLIAIGSLVYARFQLLAARATLLADQRRSQRQLAMEMCMKWSEFTSAETASVTRLIERMTVDQCDAIAHSGKLIIGAEHAIHLINILQLRFDNIESVLEKLKTVMFTKLKANMFYTYAILR
jgi:hypothetical protein